jgi:hypothetical protein
MLSSVIILLCSLVWHNKLKAYRDKSRKRKKNPKRNLNECKKKQGRLRNNSASEEKEMIHFVYRHIYFIMLNIREYNKNKINHGEFNFVKYKKKKSWIATVNWWADCCSEWGHSDKIIGGASHLKENGLFDVTFFFERSFTGSPMIGDGSDLIFFNGLEIWASEMLSSSEILSIETDADRLPEGVGAFSKNRLCYWLINLLLKTYVHQ